MTYSEALAYVLSLQPRGWRMGLDRIQELLRRIDDLRLTIDESGESYAVGRQPLTAEDRTMGGLDRQPPTANRQRAPAFLHIAGTNGKGSVTQYMQSILHQAGYRVGGFYSPYVYEPRERIQLGRELISEEDYAAIVTELKPSADSMEGEEYEKVSKFEFETVMGFEYWRQKKADFVALEVGMGGRLDATNVVHPAACAIVSIGLDHTQHLGNTLAEVAFEKAGILKPGVPAAIGELPSEALEAVERVAQEIGAPLWRIGREIQIRKDPKGGWSVETPRGVRFGLLPGIRGCFQPHNMALAVAAIDAARIAVEDEAVRAGVQHARLPGRFEQRSVQGVSVVLDGAHNAEAAAALCLSFEEAFPGEPCVLLTGMVEGHDPIRFYRELGRIVRAAHVAPIDFHRAQPVQVLVEALRSLGVQATGCMTADEALSAALSDAQALGCPLLVSGSFYLLGEIGPMLDRLSAAS